MQSCCPEAAKKCRRFPAVRGGSAKTKCAHKPQRRRPWEVLTSAVVRKSAQPAAPLPNHAPSLRQIEKKTCKHDHQWHQGQNYWVPGPHLCATPSLLLLHSFFPDFGKWILAPQSIFFSRNLGAKIHAVFPNPENAVPTEGIPSRPFG